ncbi:unnamed protein product [Rhizoctonia solani]|uniref:DUF7025 domain-containing protein n=1 Tax=Rhizoctonia solani TaxID=456999 RepID=A0A8H3BHW5_9AGAM|nr:unnamed protein product [Rhizoctonia solani]
MRGSHRYRPTSPPLLPNKPSDAELEDISPTAYFACFDQACPTAYFACFDQAWDQYTYGNWVTIRLKAADKDKNNPRLIFKAYKRVHGPLGPSTDDYTWIELISRELVKFLRSQHALKGVDGLNQSPPGVDARDLFLRLDILKASAVEPVLEPEEDGPAKNESKLDGLGLSLPPPVIPPAPVPSTDAGPDEAPIRPSSPANTVPPPIDTKPPLTVPEQLWLLLNFIESHFKETIEELERLKSDGYMSYKLLWAICAPGDIVESKDPASEYPVGVRVESWNYGNDEYPVGVRVESWNYGNDGSNFTIQGATYAWDGKVFKQDIAPVEIAFFKVHIPLSRLLDSS